MAAIHLERKIRFSNLTPTDYDIVSNNYAHQFLPILMENHDFAAMLESKESYVLPKKKLETEAAKLAEHADPTISACGKAMLRFMASGVQTLDETLIAITSVVFAGGIILSTCITVIISFILYTITVVPASLLVGALIKQHESLGRVLNNPKEKNIVKYKTLTKNIIAAGDNGISDINELSNVVNVSEAMQTVIECDYITPNENPQIHDFCSILRAVDERIYAPEGVDDIISLEMEMFDDLAPTDYTYQGTRGASNYPVTEATVLGSDDEGTEAFMEFENVLKSPLLSGKGLLQGIICAVTDATNRETTLEFMRRYRDTVKYEFTHENYSDIPIIKATGLVLEFVGNRCRGNTEIMESVDYLDHAFGTIVDEAFREVNEDASQGGAPVICANPTITDNGFNPDPFSVGSLTPFSVASRKVGSLICDIYNAETDDEITEAMLNLGRVSSIISECYTVDGDDESGYVFMESNAGKAARRASDKVHQKFSKTATKDKMAGVGAAVKRTIDPMEKFIQKQYETIKEKDANERRNVILKGGALPKVLRWVKRGIGILAMGAVGKVIPAVAIINGIVFLGYIATDKYLDRKERAKLLRELEDEIQICNEKIDDSRGDDNKQKKYELMRIRNQLTRTSEKIRLGLKY